MMKKMLKALAIVAFFLSSFVPVAGTKSSSREPVYLDFETHMSSNGCGVLRAQEGVHILQLRNCDAFAVGFAHGELLADQIIDWLWFFQIEQNMRGNVTWYRQFENTGIAQPKCLQHTFKKCAGLFKE